jgi:DUF177 domain-containing protein
MMDEYDIPVYGLKDGIHEYNFEAGLEFFKYFENQDVPDGNLRIDVLLDKKPQLMELNFRIKGSVSIICDRCLDLFIHPVELEEKLYIRFGDRTEEISENLIVMSREESRFNISHFVYEFIVLSLPVQRVHPDKKNGKPGCNTEMLKKLEKHTMPPAEDTIDPRWNALRNLMN